MKEWLCSCGAWLPIESREHVHVSEVGSVVGTPVSGFLCSTTYMRAGTEPIREQVQTVGANAPAAPCEHKRIETNIKAYRVTHSMGPHFMLEIEAHCADCGAGFQFVDVPTDTESRRGFQATADRRLFRLPMTIVLPQKGSQ